MIASKPVGHVFLYIMSLLTYGSDIIDGYIGQVNKDKYQIP